jgi:hypothetical protein
MLLEQIILLLDQIQLQLEIWKSSKRVPVLGIFITAKGITMAYALRVITFAGSH